MNKRTYKWNEATIADAIRGLMLLGRTREQAEAEVREIESRKQREEDATMPFGEFPDYRRML